MDHIDMHHDANVGIKTECSANNPSHSIAAGKTVFFIFTVNNIRQGFFTYYYKVSLFCVPDGYQSGLISEKEDVVDVKEEPIEVSFCDFLDV